jgi:hypothetical protein
MVFRFIRKRAEAHVFIDDVEITKYCTDYEIKDGPGGLHIIIGLHNVDLDGEMEPEDDG